MLTELGFHKTAFWGITPLKPKPGEEYDSLKNYAKEYVNTGLGIVLGAGGGAGAGAGLGALVGYMAKKPALGAGVGAAIGAFPGAITGGIRSLRKTERETGVKPTGVGQYFGRVFGAGIPSAAINHYLPGASILTAPVFDYAVSRKLQNHPVVQ